MAAVTAFQLLAILDRDEQLVLAGAASDGAVAWCHPVANDAAEARCVVTEASQLRGQASRAAAWGEPDLAEAAAPCRSAGCAARRSALARLCHRGRFRSRPEPRKTEKGRGDLGFAE